jgi:hypothetical protein
MTYIVCFCVLIKGNSNTIEITPPVDVSISELKKLVHKNGVCQDTDAMDLMFWTLLTMDCGWIYNTFRLGETQHMMEGFTKYWGYYLVAVLDANGVGIQDLLDALVEVNLYEE